MMVAADNLNVLHPRISEALRTLDPDPIQEMARLCEKAGAQFLDINPGYLSPREEDRMTFLVEAVQEVTSLPLILDSPRAGVLARGLRVCRSKPILNALTLEEHRLQEILPLAAEHQTSLVRNLYPRRVEEVCLTMLAGAGLDLGLINVLNPEVQALSRTINAIGEAL